MVLAPTENEWRYIKANIKCEQCGGLGKRPHGPASARPHTGHCSGFKLPGVGSSTATPAMQLAWKIRICLAAAVSYACRRHAQREGGRATTKRQCELRQALLQPTVARKICGCLAAAVSCRRHAQRASGRATTRRQCERRQAMLQPTVSLASGGRLNGRCGARGAAQGRACGQRGGLLGVATHAGSQR